MKIEIKLRQRYSTFSLVWPVMPKLVLSLARPILPEPFCPKWSPQTTFAAKIGLAGPILAAKTGLPCQVWSPQ